MPRFFTSAIDGDRAILTGEDASHITRSLRLRPGEAVTLCDGSGWDYEGIIASTGEEVTVDIREKRTSSTEPRGKITLYQALPKGDKMEWIIQKSVELGVFPDRSHSDLPLRFPSRCQKHGKKGTAL